MSGFEPALVAALTQALTGDPISAGGPDVQQLTATLADAGWTPDRVRAHALATLADGDVWPHPVDRADLDELGPARFFSALTELRKLLGVWTLETRPPSRRTTLTADERRLLAEVPPHHVG